MAKSRTGNYNLRIVHLPISYGTAGANNEPNASWPDPPTVLREYCAAREAMNGGEQIVQGLKNSTGAMKLRIKGRAIPMNDADRIKNKYTGEVFHVTGITRDTDSTIINVERVVQQTTGQEGGQ